MATSSSNIVVEWLRSLHLGQYAEDFLDNGYDDLEICKQVGDPDLDAIGVFNPVHRSRLLQSVRTLREEGAASVYFTLEETASALHDDCVCDNVSAGQTSSSRGSGSVLGVGGASSSGACSDKDVTRLGPPGGSPAASSSAGSGQELARYLDEYEEGKAELVKIPKQQLRTLLREKIQQDGIRLSCQPYSTPDGERGYLEGLASRYADAFGTHYGDVLEHLEALRRQERAATGGGGAGTPGTPPPPIGLTTSQSQPIYVPGKYSPSSCLSDKEEDEIYGFGYGVFGKQILQRQQQRLMQGGAGNSSSQQPLVSQQYCNYQSCLSPRSAYFYEFPPSDQNGHGTCKKKTTFSRLLRGLKTSHRKDKHAGTSPRHGRVARPLPPQRVDTPDSVLQAGGSGFSPDLAQHTILRSMVDPRDYDRLRFFQMNGGAPNSFEETIHRLKVQEALKKKEKFHREHEEILRDIRQGLLQFGKEGVRGPLSGDDTYMYDEDVRVLGRAGTERGHWYDEPPYESDPEDFLMGANSPGVPTATIQNGRVCFSLNLRNDQRGEGIISLRSAGDISLPKDTPGSNEPRRGLILPQAGPYPPTIIPLRSSRDRESGDYAGSDVQSVSSRLSTISVETSRSEQQGGISPQYLPHPNGGKGRPFRKVLGYMPHSEDGLSPSQSSDYEDQEELDSITQQVAAVHMVNDGRLQGVSNLVNRVRGLRQDVQRKITRLRDEAACEQQQRVDQAFPCSTSSIESLPSGSGSTDDRETSPTIMSQIIGRARALVDNMPSPYDKEALKFKQGDIIDIISMNPTGIWRGICHNRVGTFKFINVELLSERAIRSRHEIKWLKNARGKPCSVEDLLIKINMQEHISVFVLNGYEDIELFKEIEPADLDYLGILNPEHRAKILAAVQFLHDLDSGSEGDIAESSSEGDEHMRALSHNNPFNRRQFPRDSGCYDASLKSTRKQREDLDKNDLVYNDNVNNLDSVVEQCSNEILARVKQAQNSSKEDIRGSTAYRPNIPITSPSNDRSPSSDKVPILAEPMLGLKGIEIKRHTAGIRSSGRKATPAVIEDTCEADQKLTSVKYIAGGNNELAMGCESSNAVSSLGRGGCLSEKSSDSGVSSSSLSSTIPRTTAPVSDRTLTTLTSCANRVSPTNTTSTGVIIQGSDSKLFE